MVQRIIRVLKQKELLFPAVFVLTLLVVFSLIIILGQFFHQSLQEEMAGQFNQQQLLLSQEVALNIEGFIDHVFKTIRVIDRHGILRYDSSHPGEELEQIDLSRTNYFQKVRLLPKNEKLITDLLDIHDDKPQTKEFIVARSEEHTS